MVLLNALSAENGQMIRAVKMLYSLVVLVAQKTVNTLLVFKIDVPQNAVSFYYFI